MTIYIFRWLSISIILSIAICQSAHSKTEVSFSENINVLVNRTIEEFNIPGIAVAIVKDNQLIHAKGYGVRNINLTHAVDENTLFQIASNSKSMTAAGLAILIEDKKLSWDDKVIDFLPEFKLQNKYAEQEFTIKDLLTHRSGLPIGAGDLLFFPNPEKTTVNDIFNALAHIQPVSSFRNEYAYDNQLYILAGEIIRRVSGLSWSEFIETRLFAPIGMQGCYGSHERVPENANQATPHIQIGDELVTYKYESSELTAAAGGVNCSAVQMSKWLLLQLNKGKAANGNQVFSEARHLEMWSPVTPINSRIDPVSGEVDFVFYALGWGVGRKMNHQVIGHSGGVGGMLSKMTIIPKQNLGIVILTNGMNGYAVAALENGLLEMIINEKHSRSFEDYLTLSQNDSSDAINEMAEQWSNRDLTKKATLPLASYANQYADVWYGKVDIKMIDGELRFLSHRSADLTGTLKHFEGDSFVVIWDDRSLLADAKLTFMLEKEAIIGIQMETFDPRADFSFDFHHLNLKPYAQ
ncbi:serine hydrolase [Aliiglaciecola sp. 2_MG-2023]|uniref:serine hydrolase n=1 Tax=unclassified Aliiglaciecola TaxID=2593648 RepID=UPI0026E37C5F|nr:MULTISPECIES: serine hydrolase [unclassified Aliiglaciecola]MDO6713424.1 serine hydrolase [Aliiglaciecola sp. 2_MG-2023]MDO6754556.1 serine hydrolase [Aliiglaciecola sp. 1_MG-2023]